MQNNCWPTGPEADTLAGVSLQGLGSLEYDASARAKFCQREETILPLNILKCADITKNTNSSTTAFYHWCTSPLHSTTACYHFFVAVHFTTAVTYSYKSYALQKHMLQFWEGGYTERPAVLSLLKFRLMCWYCPLAAAGHQHTNARVKTFKNIYVHSINWKVNNFQDPFRLTLEL